MLFRTGQHSSRQGECSGNSGIVRYLLDRCLGAKKIATTPRKGGCQDARICLRVWGHVESAVLHRDHAWHQASEGVKKTWYCNPVEG
jgi:hypothetical protein